MTLGWYKGPQFGQHARHNQDTVRVSVDGRIWISDNLSAAIGCSYSVAVLGADPDQQTVAMQFSTESGVTGAHRVSKTDKGKGRPKVLTVGAYRFFDYIRYDRTRSRTFAARYTQSNRMLTIDLKRECGLKPGQLHGNSLARLDGGKLND